MDSMAESKYLVYLITDPYTGKQYAGQTNQKIAHRICGHVTSVRRGYLTRFGSAIAMYGIKNFTVSVLREGMTKEQADYEEQLAIRTLHLTDEEFGYNITNGGSGHPKKRQTLPEEAVEMYKSGMSAKDVGKRFGKSVPFVARNLREKGIVLNHRAGWKPNQQRPLKPLSDDAIMLYLEGFSFAELGEMYGFSECGMRNRLIKLGVVPRGQIGQGTRPRVRGKTC